jgi:hypothetical protein
VGRVPADRSPPRCRRRANRDPLWAVEF